MRLIGSGLALAGFLSVVRCQPTHVDGGIGFSFNGDARDKVALTGDFNGWSREEDQLRRDSSNVWKIVKHLSPGVYQYKFLVDGVRYELDSHNPATVGNYNGSSQNSVFVVTQAGDILLTSTPPGTASNLNDEYAPVEGKKAAYLNIVWHQHQPLYVDPQMDCLTGPWVRTHATKDYYDMAAMLEKFPKIHCNINLTSSLLLQLREYYVERLDPFVDKVNNRIDADGFLKQWGGKTDPWIDLALKPTNEFNNQDKQYLYRNGWNAFGISDVMISRFPEYLRLKQKLDVDQPPGYDLLTVPEMREAKFWFFLAYFDPDFLTGPVHLPDGSVCDLSDVVEFRTDGKFYKRTEVTEEDCNRMVAEACKVMANIIPIHRKLLYDPEERKGQIEVITTPYYHPILPLIYDSDLAKICQPYDSLPTRFSYPEDANTQVAKAVKMYQEIFGVRPRGMWPGEGSVAQPILETLRKNGIVWTASDAKVLRRSRPEDRPNTTPYRFPAGIDGSNGSQQSVALVFRDTELSDRIGFKYQDMDPEEAAEDFVQAIRAKMPALHDADVLVTVILDGENAWEWYRRDMDGKKFLNALYRKLTRLNELGQVITTTTSEYLEGDRDRGIPPHAVADLPAMERLYPASWINANYDTWIGEPEENRAWEYLLKTRQDLAGSSIAQPDPMADKPAKSSREWLQYMAWEEMYAAEGSDWFWWFGKDQSAPGGEKPFDDGFRTHLHNVYRFANEAGAKIPVPEFPPIIVDNGRGSVQGTMSQGGTETQAVVFTCDASAELVSAGVFIAGDIQSLGEWNPNTVRMYDDGTHGDPIGGDGIWSILVDVPIGTEIHYKYTNSGKEGEWGPGEEFPSRNRTLSVGSRSDAPLVIKDVFGRLEEK